MPARVPSSPLALGIVYKIAECGGLCPWRRGTPGLGIGEGRLWVGWGVDRALRSNRCWCVFCTRHLQVVQLGFWLPHRALPPPPVLVTDVLHFRRWGEQCPAPSQGSQIRSLNPTGFSIQGGGASHTHLGKSSLATPPLRCKVCPVHCCAFSKLG